jgi:Putative Flp pilus-assembly TadE/G-like
MRARASAQALIFVAVALPMFVAMAGLAIDGALLLAQRRELQSAVDGAARAGATRVDMELLRASGGSDVRLDLERARVAGETYLDQTLARGVRWHTPPEWHVEATPTRVRVVVEGRLHTAFLGVVGVDDIPVGATADAAVHSGIRAPITR